MRSLLRNTWPAFALLFGLAFMLTGCGTFSYQAAQDKADQAEADSKPRLRVKTLATVLKSTRDQLGLAYDAKLITAAELAGTKAPNDRAEVEIKRAGELLDDADADRRLAASAETTAQRLQYEASAALNEGQALQRARAAEADMAPLRQLLQRSRGVVVPIAPAPAQPAGMREYRKYPRPPPQVFA